MKVNKSELILLPVLGIHLMLLLLYFYKCPIFHSTMSIDPFNHSKFVNSILLDQGEQMLRTMTYPLGLHFFLSLIAKGLGGELIIAVRYGMAFIEFLTTLMVYSVVRRAIKSDRAALYATIAYALILVPGLCHFTNSGTYANLYGEFITLIVIYFISICLRHSMNMRTGVSMFILGAALAFSHSTAFIFFTFIWLFTPLVYVKWRDRFRRYLFSVSSLSFPLLAIFILFPRSIQRIQGVLQGGFMSILPVDPFYTFLSDHLPRLIIFGFLYIFAHPLNFIVLLASCIFMVKFRKEFWKLFTLGWFLYVCVLSIQGSNVWRFALYALTPASLLFGYFLSTILPSLSQRVSKLSTSKAVNLINVKVLPVVLIVVLITFSSTNLMIMSFLDDTEFVREKHLEVYDSMKWVEENTASDAAFISIELRDYRYLPLVGHRKFSGDYSLYASEVLFKLQDVSFNYMVLWFRFAGLDEYRSSESFEKVFENKQVVILKLIESV